MSIVILRRPRPSPLPGFGLTLGITLTYLGLMVLIPLSTIMLKTAVMTWPAFWETITSPRVVASYRLTFSTAAAASALNMVFGLLLAWVLARYQFPGKRLVDGLIDLPFALPTAVAGICLTSIYSQNGWVGRHLEQLGIKVAFTPLGIVVALVFIGIPFVVRTVQPVLEDLDEESEEAASSLGASRLQTFLKVILPVVLPALLTGFAMAFARALGEYGSVVFISGNLPMKTEIVPLIIVTKLEGYDVPGATALGAVMLVASFVMLFIINLLQGWSQSRTGAKP